MTGADTAMPGRSECGAWAKGDPLLEAYHDREWCKAVRDDDAEFELLCLEGASTGLAWRAVLHRREAYRAAFHGFRIDACAAMTDAELESLLSDAALIRSRSKIFSVRKNAQAVQRIREEFGSFDAYLRSFTDGRQIDGHWKTPAEVPAESVLSRKMAADMKKRGIAFAGPVITYSFLQAVGIVNDHLADCGCR